MRGEGQGKAGLTGNAKLALVERGKILAGRPGQASPSSRRSIPMLVGIRGCRSAEDGSAVRWLGMKK